MLEEVVAREDLPDEQSGEQSLPETEPDVLVESETARLENLIIQKDGELSGANSRLAELEQVITGRDSEIVALEQIRVELDERLRATGDSLTEAIGGYRAMVIEANPEVIEELISGDSIESINQSLDKAKALVSKVRQGMESEISLVRVPAGAPERTPADLSALSAREKIQYAVAGQTK